MIRDAHSGFLGPGHDPIEKSEKLEPLFGYREVISSHLPAERKDETNVIGVARIDDPVATSPGRPNRKNLGRQGRERLKRRKALAESGSTQDSTVVRHYAPVCIDVTSRSLTAKYDHAIQRLRCIEESMETRLKSIAESVETRLNYIQTLVQGGMALETRLQSLEVVVHRTANKHDQHQRSVEKRMELLEAKIGDSVEKLPKHMATTKATVDNLRTTLEQHANFASSLGQKFKLLEDVVGENRKAHDELVEFDIGKPGESGVKGSISQLFKWHHDLDGRIAWMERHRK